MPDPVSRYHGALLRVEVDAGVFPVAQARPRACRCGRRARRTARCAALTLRSASRMSLPPATFAGSLFGPTSTKSLYMTGRRLTPKPSATNFSSAAWRGRTRRRHRRAAPCRAPGPVPSATTRTLMPVFFSNAGQHVPEQAGLLGRRGRGDGDEFLAARWPRCAPSISSTTRADKHSTSHHMAFSFDKCRGFGRRAVAKKNSSTGDARPAAPGAGTRSRRPGASPAPRLCVLITILVPRAWICATMSRPRASPRDRGSRSARRETAPRAAAPTRAPARGAAARRRRARAPSGCQVREPHVGERVVRPRIGVPAPDRPRA